MLVVMRKDASEKEIRAVERQILRLGYRPHTSRGVERTVIGAIGDERGKARLQALEACAGVESVIPILKPYKLAGLELHPEKTLVRLRDNVVVGGKKIVVMAGPCSVESREQIFAVASAIKKAGASVLRGGAFKPRTSPYSFQGLEAEGLRLLREAGKTAGLPVVTEVLKENAVELVSASADMLQIGARNMQNYELLKTVGMTRKPVLLKRGPAATVSELLMAAEYVLSQGNGNVVLCERGIRTFETSTRYTLDLNAVAVLRKETHLPVIVDPSHGTGHAQYVEDMALAAIAAGADGLLIEVHPDPRSALSDGPQSLTPERFRSLMRRIAKVARAVGRDI